MTFPIISHTQPSVWCRCAPDFRASRRPPMSRLRGRPARSPPASRLGGPGDDCRPGTTAHLQTKNDTPVFDLPVSTKETRAELSMSAQMREESRIRADLKCLKKPSGCLVPISSCATNQNVVSVRHVGPCHTCRFGVGSADSGPMAAVV